MFNLKKRIKDVFEENRRSVEGHQYTVPSPEAYPYQWLWDSCFHAIILSHFDVGGAQAELRSLVSKQFESGLIPHIIYWEKNNVLEFDWGVEGTSALTQPPLIAYAAWRVYKESNDKTFLEDIYAPLARYYRHLLSRDPRGEHLVGIINPDESGEDNSPRFDAALGLSPRHAFSENNERRFELFQKNRRCDFDADTCMYKVFWVTDVAFNVYLIENLESLAAIATELGTDHDAEYFNEQAAYVRTAMREHLFADGVFWSTWGTDATPVRVKTWAMFAPLAVGLYSQNEAASLVDHFLHDPATFGTSYPLPTTALDEPAFNVRPSVTLPSGLQPNWRGPVWMAPNWFVERGLRRYGYADEAAHVREKSLELVEKSGCREYYHPETGEGLGAHGFTWAGLALDMGVSE